MFKIIQWNTFRAYKFPIPLIPSHYAVHIVLDSLENLVEPSEEIKLQIKLMISDSSIKEIHISIMHCLKPKEIKSWSWTEVSQDKLHELGLIWLLDSKLLPHLDIHFLKKNEKIKLPFIPEFAHDLARARKLIEGDFYAIKPILVEFIPTLNCTFRCRKCSYRLAKIACGAWIRNNVKNSKWHMRVDLAKHLAQECADAGIKYMIVTGGGEPLMNQGATIAALQTARKNGIRTGLFTNGSLLSESMVIKILNENLDFIRVSMNAGSEKVHTEWHRPVGGRPLFNQVQNGVKQLVFNNISMQKDTRIGLSYLVNSDNVKDSEKFANWVASIVNEMNKENQMDCSIIEFVRFTPVVDYFNQTQYYQDFINQAIEFIDKKVTPILEDANVNVILFNNRFNNINEIKDYEECFGCSWYAELGPDGALYNCCEMSFLPAYRIGNLSTDSINTIWESERRKKLLIDLKKSKLRGCPSFCKPHTINKISSKIYKQSKIPGEKKKLWQWLLDLNELYKYKLDDPFEIEKAAAIPYSNQE